MAQVGLTVHAPAPHRGDLMISSASTLGLLGRPLETMPVVGSGRLRNWAYWFCLV